MKLGLFTDSLPYSFNDALDWVVANGFEAVELGTGNYSPARHCDMQKLLDDESARTEFKRSIESRGLTLSALNCSGRLLDPQPDHRQKAEEVFYRTIELAGKLDVDTVVTLAGCPGEPGGSSYPNWIAHHWPRETGELYRRQWEELVTPFWMKAARFAADHGVRIAIEMHPAQIVYNTHTLLRLREIVGPNLGANFDPSHLFFQGMDPIRVICALGENIIFHVHAKDTRLNPDEIAINGGLDPRPEIPIAKRPWAYRTVGFGHGESWWRDFVSALRAVGYDGVLSVEHEDLLMGAPEGIIKSAEFLKPILLRTLPEGAAHWVT
jgi:sugar phosphate isomerase/epimerase